MENTDATTAEPDRWIVVTDRDASDRLNAAAAGARRRHARYVAGLARSMETLAAVGLDVTTARAAADQRRAAADEALADALADIDRRRENCRHVFSEAEWAEMQRAGQ